MMQACCISCDKSESDGKKSSKCDDKQTLFLDDDGNNNKQKMVSKMNISSCLIGWKTTNHCVIFCCWVKGMGAGRKVNLGWPPPKPDTSNMTVVFETKEALLALDKQWKKERDIQLCKNCDGGEVDDCSFVDETVGYTGCILLAKKSSNKRGGKIPFAEGHTFSKKDTLLM